MEQSLSSEAKISSAGKEIPSFYETRNFTDAFASARQLLQSWARSIQFMPSIPLLENPF
jgi:hypothetical protein